MSLVPCGPKKERLAWEKGNDDGRWPALAAVAEALIPLQLVFTPLAGITDGAASLSWKISLGRLGFLGCNYRRALPRRATLFQPDSTW